MQYRSDVDGLRAIAIILVLIYHGKLSLFPSGFIGVDIFFVISGFLITHMINQGIDAGTFSFLDFYNRRLWRLQPVFIGVIFFTCLSALLLFLPDDLMQYARSMRKASLYMTNVFFNKTTTGYFSSDTFQLPLLHTWSLSIEWQCYLFLPLVIYGLKRLLKDQYLIGAIVLIAVFCFFVTLHDSKLLPSQSYYLFSSRIFEFCIGALIAVAPQQSLLINTHLITFLGGLSLFIIFYTASLNHILPGYPNWHAVGVCLASGMLVAFGKFSPHHLIVKLLSLRPLVWIGLLSYSLYIWHWPIFAFIRYENIEETSWVLFMVYGCAFVFSMLSWKYIEKPLRRFNTLSWSYSVVSLLLVPIAIIHASAYLIDFYDGFPRRFNPELVHVYQKLNQYASQQRPLCISNSDVQLEQCKLGATTSGSATGFLMGDSFSNHYWGFMDNLGKDAGVSILAQGTSSCLALPGIYLYDWWHFKDQVYQECYQETQKYYAMIEKNHFNYVIIGQIWPNYLTDNIINSVGDKRSIPLTQNRITVALDKALALIVASGAKPMLLKTTASSSENARDCFFKHFKMHQPYKPEACDFKEMASEATVWFDELFNKMKLKYPELIIVDPKAVQCQHGTCQAALNGVPVYRDIGHITDYASFQLAELYLKKFHNPFATHQSEHII